MASLNEKRTFFHLSAIGPHLYAVGGRNSAGELATVEKYHPKENQVDIVLESNIHSRQTLALPLHLFQGRYQHSVLVGFCVQNAGTSLWPCWHGLWWENVHFRRDYTRLISKGTPLLRSRCR